MLLYVLLFTCSNYYSDILHPKKYFNFFLFVRLHPQHVEARRYPEEGCDNLGACPFGSRLTLWKIFRTLPAFCEAPRIEPTIPDFSFRSPTAPSCCPSNVNDSFTKIPKTKLPLFDICNNSYNIIPTFAVSNCLT